VINIRVDEALVLRRAAARVNDGVHTTPVA
jgi:hypothetical protein